MDFSFFLCIFIIDETNKVYNVRKSVRVYTARQLSLDVICDDKNRNKNCVCIYLINNNKTQIKGEKLWSQK
jgi:hypothetical protein